MHRRSGCHHRDALACRDRQRSLPRRRRRTVAPRREFDIGAFNRTMVLNNGTVFGTVNANRHHYAAAADALARADRAWLSGLITRRVPLTGFADALRKQKGDIKVVIDFAQA